MQTGLQEIRVLRSTFRRLNAERRAERFHPPADGPARTRYQERGGDFRDRLLLEIESRRDKARILVTGQIGVGKSSELWDFREERFRNGDLGFPLYCDLEKEESPERCGTTGLFLTILRDCYASTRGFMRQIEGGRTELNEIREDIFARLVDWLEGTIIDDQSQVVFAFSGMDFPIQLSDKSRALGIILGKAALHESVAEPSKRFSLAPDALVVLLNKLLRWFARFDNGRKPLLIIDHVDKIRDPIAAEDVLVKTHPQWSRLEASVVMTAPFESTLGSLRTSVESRWDRVLRLHPLEIPELEEGQIPDIYMAIARNSGLESLISPDALRLLAYYSGGILRMFVQFLGEAAQEAHLATHRQIDAGDARAVVFKAEQAYIDYGERELRLLDEIERIGTGLADAASLLRSPIGLLVNEPRRDQPALRVHPLALTTLERFRLNKARGEK